MKERIGRKWQEEFKRSRRSDPRALDAWKQSQRKRKMQENKLNIVKENERRKKGKKKKDI